MKFKPQLIFISIIIFSTSFNFVATDTSTDDINSVDTQPLEQNVHNAFDYLPLFIEAEETYLEKNETEATITCAHCKNKQLGMSEFVGNLLSRLIKSTIEGIEDNHMQSILENFLQIMTEGNSQEMKSAMLRVANDIQYNCTHCFYAGENSYWE